jgi:hypothetical protein
MTNPGPVHGFENLGDASVRYFSDFAFGRLQYRRLLIPPEAEVPPSRVYDRSEPGLLQFSWAALAAGNPKKYIW